MKRRQTAAPNHRKLSPILLSTTSFSQATSDCCSKTNEIEAFLPWTANGQRSSIARQSQLVESQNKMLPMEVLEDAMRAAEKLSSLMRTSSSLTSNFSALKSHAVDPGWSPSSSLTQISALERLTKFTMSLTARCHGNQPTRRIRSHCCLTWQPGWS